MGPGADYFPEGWTQGEPKVTNVRAVVNHNQTQFTCDVGLFDDASLGSVMAMVLRGAERLSENPEFHEYSQVWDCEGVRHLYERDLNYWEGLQVLHVYQPERQSLLNLLAFQIANGET